MKHLHFGISKVILATVIVGGMAALTPAAWAITIPVACSENALVAAVNLANSTSAADTLVLAGGCTYNLTSAHGGLTDGLPVITTPIEMIGPATITRSSLLEVMREDYIRTAWAKGLRERVVVIKHSLKNALIPVITILGIQVAQILGGTVIFESIFGLPGMGRFLFDAINQRDYPVIQGVNLLVVVTVVAVNLAVDALYAVLDPRIRY